VTWLGEQWHGRILLGGWVPGSAGDRAVTAPATGAELARIGLAGPTDVAAATEQAAEIGHWIVNESGSVPGKAELGWVTIRDHIAAYPF